MKNYYWSTDFAYALGLITSDGNLSSDGRHLAFISTDMDLIDTFKQCLNLKNSASLKKCNGYSRGNSKKCYVVQFGNVKLYRLLKLIGLGPNKSKNIAGLFVPRKYFPDFLRGLIDGDGHIHVFRHPESRHLQLNLRVISGSYPFLKWLEKYIQGYLNVTGKIRRMKGGFELNYYKKSSIYIFKKIYYNDAIPYLKRKYQTAKLFLSGCSGTGRHVSLRS